MTKFDNVILVILMLLVFGAGFVSGGGFQYKIDATDITKLTATVEHYKQQSFDCLISFTRLHPDGFQYPFDNFDGLGNYTVVTNGIVITCNPDGSDCRAWKEVAYPLGVCQ